MGITQERNTQTDPGFTRLLSYLETGLDDDLALTHELHTTSGTSQYNPAKQPLYDAAAQRLNDYENNRAPYSLPSIWTKYHTRFDPPTAVPGGKTGQEINDANLLPTASYDGVTATDVIKDAAGAAADFAKGASAGLKEINTQQTALDNMADYHTPAMPVAKERLTLDYTPKPGYSQNDVDFQKAQLDKAKQNYHQETNLPAVMLLGAAAAPFTGGLSATCRWER